MTSRTQASCWILTRAERAEFYKLLDEAPWEGKTASGHWQTRDLCGHYDRRHRGLSRIASHPPAQATELSRAARAAHQGRREADEGAQRFRSLSKPEAIAPIKDGVGQDVEIFDALDEKHLWASEMVPHVFSGPPASRLLAAFELPDHSIHTWDAGAVVGPQFEPLALDAAAVTSIPFMMIVLQYTVDAERAADLSAKFGIEITGPGGGSWSVGVEGTAVRSLQRSTEGKSAGDEVHLLVSAEGPPLSIFTSGGGGTVSGYRGYWRARSRFIVQNLRHDNR